MSVLIKGMEMPKGCLGCPCINAKYNECMILQRRATDVMTRMTDCPLIELPDHGRLVDADDVIAESRCGIYWWETEQQVPQILNEIPTIIPAERSE